jgi:AbrB family looped-hinge helix DNA binding protein
MSRTARITEKGQTTIPHELREKYDLEPGDEVVWLDGENGILVKKRSRMDARGMLLKGRSLNHDPADAREKLVTTGPLTVVGFGNADVSAYLNVLDELTIHDGMIVASHRTRDIGAVVYH